MFEALTSRSRESGLLMVAVLTVCGYLLAGGEALERVDHLIYDHFLSAQQYHADERIVIVAVDDSSLKRLGRWPWSRARHAQLLDRLTAMQARAVGFDILFSESQSSDPEADRQFAEAMARNGKTIMAVAPSNPLPNSAITEVMPLPIFAAEAAGIGHVDIEVDTDGVCRSFYLFAGLGEPHWPSFALALLRVGGENVTPDYDPKLIDARGPSLGWTRSGRYFVPFDPSDDALEVIPYHKVLNDDAVAARIKDKFVIVGSTATGLGDVISTPVSTNHQRMPGVELTAHILSGLLQEQLVRQMDGLTYRVLTVILVGLAALWMVSVSFPVAMLSFVTSVAGILAFTALWLFVGHQWFPPAAAIAPLVIGLPVWGAWSLLAEKQINRSLTDRMQHQALHHSTTDLPNQYVLEERLRKLSSGTADGDTVAALMIVHTKWPGGINNLVGHSSGDRLLRAVARRLSDAVRTDDLVAHLNGDDFAVLIQNLTDPDSALRIAHNLMTALQQPVEVDNKQIFLSPRMGLSLWPRDGQDGNTLLRNAYIAMYRARVEQSGMTCVYSEAIAEEVQAHSQLEQALVSAMERGEFEVYYQPQVVTQSGRIVGVEALLRWQNPELGLVYPGTFIPVAEHNGLIQAIGGWVLRTACMQVQRWNEQGLGPLRLAVNLSPLQFADGNIVAEVRSALTESGLDPRSLELEITESALMQNMELATEAMRLLKEEGVKLAIDDFGTGYSSLSNLQHFPLDRIKIDQSFTREINNNPNVREITLTIITMAKKLRLEVIAEGVETESQADFLGQHGCDELQGYFFGHPLPAVELADLLDASAAGRPVKAGQPGKSTLNTNR